MKDQKKAIKPNVEKLFGIELTLSEDLVKYSGVEFSPEKLKKAEKKFSKKVAHH